MLFIGLGVDFGIQFSVRYRQERFKEPDLRKPCARPGRAPAIPLTLAAAAVTAGFLSFLPTAYLGLSELGEVAGAGMIIAYLTSVRYCPRCIYVLRPAGEPEGLGFTWLAPVDDFLETYRVPVVVVDARYRLGGIAAAALPAFRLQSDEPAQPQGRIDRNLSRPATRPRASAPTPSTC